MFVEDVEFNSIEDFLSDLPLARAGDPKFVLSLIVSDVEYKCADETNIVLYLNSDDVEDTFLDTSFDEPVYFMYEEVPCFVSEYNIYPII